MAETLVGGCGLDGLWKAHRLDQTHVNICCKISGSFAIGEAWTNM